MGTANKYIEMSKDLINRVPCLKEEIETLTKQISVAEEGDRKAIECNIKFKITLLKYIARALQSVGRRGAILAETYFSDMSMKQIVRKYDVDIKTVWRNKQLDKVDNYFWEELAIVLYGIDALMLDEG